MLRFAFGGKGCIADPERIRISLRCIGQSQIGNSCCRLACQSERSFGRELTAFELSQIRACEIGGQSAQQLQRRHLACDIERRAAAVRGNLEGEGGLTHARLACTICTPGEKAPPSSRSSFSKPVTGPSDVRETYASRAATASTSQALSNASSLQSVGIGCWGSLVLEWAGESAWLCPTRSITGNTSGGASGRAMFWSVEALYAGEESKVMGTSTPGPPCVNRNAALKVRRRVMSSTLPCESCAAKRAEFASCYCYRGEL